MLEDLVIVAFLVFLEGILSIDNALVLAMMAKPLPKVEQRKALTYGLVGAVIFRVIAIASAVQLMQWNWVKFVGGGYLLLIALKHFWSSAQHGDPKAKASKSRGFWQTVVMIELVDIAFAVDSILAAVSLTSKKWIILTGGLLGVVLMRFAANMFITLLHRFPNLETTAYLLVAIIGLKVFGEALRLEWLNFHSAASPAFWVFWGLMASCIVWGLWTKSDATKSQA